ncbi:hypothetical protein KY358_03215 [Candidatus Woesearchaeota archaeon]|nr:hypothetical protein [Candidatus Woesearchaeota archaeon]
MIQKIRGLMQVKEAIDETNRKIGEHSCSVSSLKEDILGLTGELNEIKASQREFLAGFRENIGIIHESKESLKKEVYDFRLLKAQLQKSILEKFEEELSKELKANSETLKADISEYNHLKEQASSIISRIDSLSAEMAKLAEISRSIKKEDFELSRFAHRLMENDREKLELMGRIDTLERLISRMRRGR